jgi:tetratricopeptide (TPR) repeat protein
VEWGRIGQNFLGSSGVDSKFTNTITHNLALAERDSGRPEVALPIFLNGRTLPEVVDPDELDEQRGEHHYGNIGRCLHLMGQSESALICYQKAALLLERSTVRGNVTNKGYARTWIGKLLAGREELTLAYVFLQSALRLWERVAPPKTVAVSGLMKQIESRAGHPLRAKDGQVDKICLDWILGAHIDIGGDDFP